jgi:hypothetical protein
MCGVGIDEDPYRVLGVARTATQDEIRAAYRRLARRLHPDVARSGDEPVDMAAVNRAWEMLSDPARRRTHDQRAAERVTGAATSARRPDIDVDDHPFVPLPPSRFPWRFLLFLALMASIAVLTAHARSSPPARNVPDQLLTPGSCVDVGEMSMVVEVRCDGPHDGVVRQFLAIDRTCPQDTDTFRDRQGMGRACVDLVEVGDPAGSG